MQLDKVSFTTACLIRTVKRRKNQYLCSFIAAFISGFCHKSNPIHLQPACRFILLVRLNPSHRQPLTLKLHKGDDNQSTSTHIPWITYRSWQNHPIQMGTDSMEQHCKFGNVTTGCVVTPFALERKHLCGTCSHCCKFYNFLQLAATVSQDPMRRINKFRPLANDENTNGRIHFAVQKSLQRISVKFHNNFPSLVTPSSDLFRFRIQRESFLNIWQALSKEQSIHRKVSCYTGKNNTEKHLTYIIPLGEWKFIGLFCVAKKQQRPCYSQNLLQKRPIACRKDSITVYQN